MAKHIWSVLCRRGLLDRYTNNVSLVDVFEQLRFFPGRDHRIEEGNEWVMLPEEAALVSFFVRSQPDQPEQPRVRVQVISPTGAPFEGGALVSDLDLSEHNRSRNFAVLKHLPFWSSGTYWFSVQLEGEGTNQWNEVARIPLEIHQLDESDRSLAIAEDA